MSATVPRVPKGFHTLPMQDHEYGDRQGGLTDPFGHVWYVASRIRDLED